MSRWFALVFAAPIASCGDLPSKFEACELDTDCSIAGHVCRQDVCVPRDDAGTNGGDGGLDAPGDGSPGDAIADARPCSITCANGGTPDTYVDSVTGTCWASCSNLLRYSAAVAACAEIDGKLASIIAATDQQSFNQVRVTGDHWLGLVQSNTASDTDLMWTWSTGEPLPPNDPRWAAGEPNDSDGDEVSGDNPHREQCALMAAGMDRFKDKPCNEGDAYPYVCRR